MEYCYYVIYQILLTVFLYISSFPCWMYTPLVVYHTHKHCSTLELKWLNNGHCVEGTIKRINVLHSIVLPHCIEFISLADKLYSMEELLTKPLHVFLIVFVL